MPEYSVLKEKTKNFGKNGYIEVALKRVTDGNDGREFLTITRGYINQEGARRWVRYVTMPADQAMRDFLLDAVNAFADGASTPPTAAAHVASTPAKPATPVPPLRRPSTPPARAATAAPLV